MTVQEAAKVVRMLHTAVQSDRKATEEDLADRIDFYAVFFAEYPGELVYKVAFAWTKISPYMPAPEEIKRHCDEWIKLSGHLKNAGVISSFSEPIDQEDEERINALWDSLIAAEEDGKNAKQIRDYIR